MWLHADLMHILFNMFALWMFGSQLAMYWGEQRFLRYYLTCGFGAGFVIATIPYLVAFMGLGEANLGQMTLGASGACFGVLLAFSFTWPERTIMLIFPPIPIKAIWLIPLILFMENAQPRTRASARWVTSVASSSAGSICSTKARRRERPPSRASRTSGSAIRCARSWRAVRTEETRDPRRWRNDSDRMH